jgi:cytochrome c-type biogenesis protein CcmH
MLWFALAVMTGLAVMVALWPLAFRRAASADVSTEVEFHRTQLAEIERDVERGQLPPEEAVGARTEAARRLLAAARPGQPARADGDNLFRRRAASVCILVAIPLIALGVYAKIGKPEMPDAPLAERKADAASPEALDAAIAKIEAHLAATPDDDKGWAVLAPVYMRLGRFEDAIGAYRQLLRIRGENGVLRADLGEAILAAAGGVVTAEARAAFEQALVDTPDLPKARFYLALATEQDGDATKALAIYRSLIRYAVGGAPWMVAMRERLAAIESGAPLSPSPVPTPPPGMSPDAQQDMIRGMVARLAARLAQSGGTVEEWVRLIRAYSVLHETDKAKEALASARKALGGDAAAMTALTEIAREVGLGD